MRKWIMSAAVVAALGFVATPAKAQIILSSGYSSPYYGGYGGYNGLSVGNGAILNSVIGGSPVYGGYSSYYGGMPPYGGYSNFGNYGYSTPYYGGSYYRGGYSNYYGGRSYGGRWGGRRWR